MNSIPRRTIVVTAVATCFVWLVANTATAAPNTVNIATAPKPTLTAFANEDELKAWFENLRKRKNQDQTRAKVGSVASTTAVYEFAVPAPAAPAVQTMQAPAQVMAMGSDKGAVADLITNVQTAGVDEGGIVKVHGDHLVVLRRGRLFTVSLKSGGLTPVSAVDAFGPGISPDGAWYDEMLIGGNTVVVIGYSYQRGGTEVGLFEINAAGTLSHRSTYHMRSNDYYSSRNYASRLVGDKLIFYTPLRLNLYGDPTANFPAVRKWRGDATSKEFKRIAPATRIYRTDDDIEPYNLTLHTVTICDLGGGNVKHGGNVSDSARSEIACEATAVLGTAGRVFYVSQGSVFVWTTEYARGREAHEPARYQSAVFRIPLDGAAPTALKTSGSPIDQFSLLESDDGHLNVLVRAFGRGEAMWAAESSRGATALLRVPLARFGDGRDAAPASAYRKLPFPHGHMIQNRFVGEWLLYGTGNSWGPPIDHPNNAVHAVRWANTSSTVQTLSLPHAVDRIEALGRHAVLVGTGGKDLYFSSLRLNNEVSIPQRFTRENAAQGETRSHGFFYKPDSGNNGGNASDNGVIGLPVVGAGQPGSGQLTEGSASVMFLRNESLMLSPMGELSAKPDTARNDNCKASCVDWYGNARPLFLKNRVFALMGYEIVEGRIEGDGIGEVRRISFAPK
ncbi:MAG: beta-propeller domain-containing protein [Prolixibacteraceae bacterium]|nr:beta-propeller domain-containing protein [Burkholderiales bacterium]